MPTRYIALVSSDWNECLAPCGPFDVIGFHFPELAPAIESIFRHYTANTISLGSAIEQVSRLLPGPITTERMDAYLECAFATYTGVPELIEACRRRGILFMINTTGMCGYFQRVMATRRLPRLAALSAHPMVRFANGPLEKTLYYPLLEIADKAKNTAAAAAHFNIAPGKTVLMGDSGGDGPHFQWGAQVGAHLIGCMVKPSLTEYCRQQRIAIDSHFGPVYAPGESKDAQRELRYDFRQLLETIEALVV